MVLRGDEQSSQPRAPELNAAAGLECHQGMGSATVQLPTTCYPRGMMPCIPSTAGCPNLFYTGSWDSPNTCCAPLAGTDLFACQNPARNPTYCGCTVPKTWSAIGTAHSCQDGNCPEKYTADVPNAGAISSDGTTLFIEDVYAGTIVSLPADPSLHTEGTPPTILASKQSLGSSLVVDRDNLYWTNTGFGVTMPTTGGTPVPLTSIGPGASALSVAGDYIYWSAGTGVAKRLIAGGPMIVLSTPRPGCPPEALAS